MLAYDQPAGFISAGPRVPPKGVTSRPASPSARRTSASTWEKRVAETRPDACSGQVGEWIPDPWNCSMEKDRRFCRSTEPEDVGQEP